MRQPLATLICCLSILPCKSYSEEPEQPAWWELGIGVALVSYPHYPGAEQVDTLLTPFPYPVYHSEHISLDEEGLVASVAQGGRFSLKASLNGSLPVGDGDNRARAGMEDLDLLLEAGPSLHILLAENDRREWRIELPLRGALRISDNGIGQAGWTANPGLYYERTLGLWQLESSLGGIWSTRDYHGFFYDVKPTEAAIGRPAYIARSGFTGSRASLTLKRRWERTLAIGYLRYMNFSGATNQASPLLKQDDYLAAGISFIYLFYSTK